LFDKKSKNMKTRKLLFPAVLILLAILIQSNISADFNSGNKGDIDIPENVKSVLDNKCFGCHNSESEADKAKDKLLLDKLGDLSKAKMIATFVDIAEVASEGEMPPEKFLEQKPEKKLTEEEQNLIAEWANQTADNLLN
jgi:uncharacterized membrane protein